jgi:transcriptional regulator with XRE-family HTH domain
MTSHAGRRYRPPSTDLPPARRQFVDTLRSHLPPGVSQERLADQVGVSKATISRILSGTRLPTSQQVRDLNDALDAEGPEKERILTLFRHAVEEADGVAPPGVQLTTSRGALSELLADLLGALKDESGLSVREITERIAATGVAASKSSVDRALRDPSSGPRLSLHAAEALLNELPLSRRGPLRDALYRALVALDDGNVLAPSHGPLVTEATALLREAVAGIRPKSVVTGALEACRRS